MGMSVKDLFLIEDCYRAMGKDILCTNGRAEQDIKLARRPESMQQLKNKNETQGATILELGNQILKLMNQYGQRISSKRYLSKIGISHTSIDVNNQDGALKLDLTHDLVGHGHLTEQFDIVTNFGTSEHVKNQYACWRNIHNLCREGGFLINVLPPVGFWKEHPNCHWWYVEAFFEQLARANDYEMIELYRRGVGKQYPKLCCVMKKKTEAEFVSPSVFKKIEIYNSWKGKS